MRRLRTPARRAAGPSRPVGSTLVWVVMTVAVLTLAATGVVLGLVRASWSLDDILDRVVEGPRGRRPIFDRGSAARDAVYLARRRRERLREQIHAACFVLTDPTAPPRVIEECARDCDAALLSYGLGVVEPRRLGGTGLILPEGLAAQPGPIPASLSLLEMDWRADLIDLALFTAVLDARRATVPARTVPEAMNRARIGQEALAYARLAEAVGRVRDHDTPFESANVPRRVFDRQARLARALGDLGAARAAESARATAPAEPDPRRERFWAIVEDLEDGRLEQATQRLGSAIEADALDPAVWLLLGNVLTAQGQSRAALDAYTAALQLRPRSKWALRARGWLRLELQQDPEALADFTRMTELSAQPREGFFGCAAAYLALDDTRAAWALLSYLLRYDDAPVAAWALRARVNDALGDNDQARSDRDQAQRLAQVADRDESARILARFKPSHPPAASDGK